MAKQVPKPPKSGPGPVKARFLPGLYYYAPLNDLKSDTLVNGVNTTAQVYGAAHDNSTGSCLFFSQTTGTLDGFPYLGGFRVQASGNNPHLRLSASSNVFRVLAPMSVAGWVRVDEIANSGGICGRSQFGVGRNYALVWDAAASMNMSFTVANVFKNAASPAGTVKVGVWTHWVGTYDQVFARIYMNGVQVGVLAETGVPDNSVGNVHAIGAFEPSGILTRAGIVKNVGVWSGRALSAADVAYLYDSGGDILQDPLAETTGFLGGFVTVSGDSPHLPLTLGLPPERGATAVGSMQGYPVVGMF